MKTLLIAAVLCILAAIMALLFWPIPAKPMAWKASAAPSLESGPYAGNERLKAIRRIATGIGHGPEAIVIDPLTGDLLTGVENGAVVRVSRDGRRSEIFGWTGGRPLGLAICPDGSVLIADGIKGLVRIRSKGAPAEVLATKAESGAFKFVDNVAVDAAGRHAYFTDATSKWGYRHDREDMVEHGGHGRVFRYDLASREITLLKDGLNFANGVALGPEGAYLLVNESGLYRTWRIWLSQDRFGQAEVFADNLPGFPDNISFNGKDRFWIALPVPRRWILDYLSDSPFVRKIIMRLMAVVNLPEKHRRAMAMAYDLDGRLVANLQYEGDDAYGYITQVTEAGGDLYIGSLFQDSMGHLPDWQNPK
ncbi:MAG: SMP-30/gluconolactonase/LRE family protein [Beijerinckiaceae bacterium]|nr:SMP-30/gluconolactonase/LRE family protein [Beijerinckiaceae bacterium]MCI0736815.1 SMP-30/gluconolactonase/LRE family protein [Beijerinckiaceae bacterium]